MSPCRTPRTSCHIVSHTALCHVSHTRHGRSLGLTVLIGTIRDLCLHTASSHTRARRQAKLVDCVLIRQHCDFEVPQIRHININQCRLLKSGCPNTSPVFTAPINMVINAREEIPEPDKPENLVTVITRVAAVRTLRHRTAGLWLKSRPFQGETWL